MLSEHELDVPMQCGNAAVQCKEAGGRWGKGGEGLDAIPVLFSLMVRHLACWCAPGAEMGTSVSGVKLTLLLG